MADFLQQVFANLQQQSASNAQNKVNLKARKEEADADRQERMIEHQNALEQQDAQEERRYQQTKIANDIAANVHKLDSLKKQAEIADYVKNGGTVPGATIKDTGTINEKGQPQAEYSFLDGLIPSFTAQSPESVKTTQLQDQRIKTEQALSVKREEEQIQERKDAAKEEKLQEGRVALEKLKAQGEKDRNDATNRVRLAVANIGKMRGDVELGDKSLPYIKGAFDGTYTEEELKKIDPSIYKVVQAVSSSSGVRVLNNDNKEKLNQLIRVKRTLDEAQSIVDRTPEIDGTINRFIKENNPFATAALDPKLVGDLAGLDSEGPLMGQAFGDKGKQSKDEEKAALANLSHPGKGKKEKAAAKKYLDGSFNLAIDSFTRGMNPAQKHYYEVLIKGEPQLNSDEVKKSNLIKKYGGNQ